MLVVCARCSSDGSRFAADIILMENIVSVFRSGSDVTMHVVGSSNEVRLVVAVALPNAD
jgi:hypothetical protein